MLEDPKADDPVRRMLLWIVGAVTLVDIAWAASGDFQIAVVAYWSLAGLSAALLLGSWFYGHIRMDERLRAMLFGTGFLCAFSAASSVLNYLLLTVAPDLRIDELLAEVDGWFGFHWPTLVALAADYPLANRMLALAYNSVLPQIAALIVCLGVFGSYRTIYSFCVALVLATAITVGFWTAFPSFGAFTAYQLDPALAARAHLVVEAGYVDDLLRLLAEGPGRIAPDQVKGLIAFPSFHAVLAVLVAWYARELRVVNTAAFVLCALVLISTPVHGGHFVIDIAAGIAAALAAAGLADWVVGRLARRRAAGQALSAGHPQPADPVQLTS